MELDAGVESKVTVSEEVLRTFSLRNFIFMQNEDKPVQAF